MSQAVVDYFNELAESAIERCHERMSDLKFYENVKARLLAGEDLSEELPLLKKVNQADAAFITDKLIERCWADMDGYWTLAANTGIQSKVSHELLEGELIPRFTAEYTTNTEVGEMTFTLASKGNHVDLDIDTGSVKNMDTAAALKEVAAHLLIFRLRAT